MVDNITIIDVNGNAIFAEGIGYFQSLSSGKKYISYTLNEHALTDMIKMYVGETTDVVGSLKNIPDLEWKQILTSLTNLDNDIKFINMSEKTYNIGIPKKLAITQEQKQIFKDRQAQAEVLIPEGMVSGTADGVLSTPSTTPQVIPDVAPFAFGTNNNQEQANLFSNSSYPETNLMSNSDGLINQSIVQTGPFQNSNESGILPSATLQQTPSAILPTVEPVTESVENMYQNWGNGDQSSASNATFINGDKYANNIVMFPNNTNSDSSLNLQSNTLANNLEPIIKTEVIQGEFHEVTKEDALKALEILNRYFKNTKELPSSLAEEFNGYNQMNSAKDQFNNANENMISVGGLDDQHNLQPQFLASQDSINSQNFNGTQEQGRTLSLVPEGIIDAAPNMANSYVDNTVPQDFSNMNYQPQNVGYQDMSTWGMEQNTPSIQNSQQNSAQSGYVASSNRPAIDMSTTRPNISDVPVTLPTDYNTQNMANSTVIMGPGSLPTENSIKAA